MAISHFLNAINNRLARSKCFISEARVSGTEIILTNF
jgi:hypothetical protein